MTRMVIIEPSLRQSDHKAVALDAVAWGEMCEVGRKQGFAFTNETIIGSVEASLFAAAVRRGLNQKEQARGGRGSERFIVAEPSILNDVRGKVNDVLSLLESGGVVITKRVW